MLKISAFYLDKQKSFVPKKTYEVYHSSRIVLFSTNRCRIVSQLETLLVYIALVTPSSKTPKTFVVYFLYASVNFKVQLYLNLILKLLTYEQILPKKYDIFQSRIRFMLN